MNTDLKKLYHFVCTESMMNKIIYFSKYMKLDKSKALRLIIDTMMPLLDNYLVFEQESQDFGYNEFGSEVDIRFYIDPNVYRKIKNAHGVMHTFSVAVLVRKMIEMFFFFIEYKSFEWLKKMMNCCIKRIIKILTKFGSFFKDTKNMVHMFGEEQMLEETIMTFSKNFTLLGIKRVKKRLVYNYISVN